MFNIDSMSVVQAGARLRDLATLTVLAQKNKGGKTSALRSHFFGKWFPRLADSACRQKDREVVFLSSSDLHSPFPGIEKVGPLGEIAEKSLFVIRRRLKALFTSSSIRFRLEKGSQKNKISWIRIVFILS
jgi:hypothetical protein